MKTLTLFMLVLLILSGCTSPTLQTDTTTATSEKPVESVEVAAADSTETLNLDPLIDVHTLAPIMDREDIFLLDVREQWEYDEGRIPGVTLIPVDQISARLAEIPKDKEVIVSCHSGTRSARITNFLKQQGYTNVHDLQGGIVAWREAGFEVEQ